jgi:hypothetical protein
MSPLPHWRDLVDKADTAVDQIWSEKANFIPWVAKDYVAGGPDPARPAANGVMVVEMDQTTMPAGEGPGFTSTQVTQDVVISVRDKYIAALNLRKDDRVVLTERGETYEISYIEPSTTLRTAIHLVRVKAP